MSPAVYRVRELTVNYTPLRLSLPVPVVGRLVIPRDAAVLSSALLADATVEKVVALHLNTKNVLIGIHIVSTGTLDMAIVHPRDVLKAACLSNAATLILIHNHPSGDPTPSPDDRALVTRLRLAGDVLGIELLDALIVTDPVNGLRYFSFREAGMLP